MEIVERKRKKMIGKEKGKRKDKLRKKGGLPSPEVTAPRTVSGGT